MLLENLPSCFSISAADPNMNGSDGGAAAAAPKMQPNLVTCVYSARICGATTLLTLTWSRTVSSHALAINVDAFSFSIPLSPPSFFKGRRGSKLFSLSQTQHRPKLHWDFTHAQFSPASAEPVSGFYLAITHKAQLQFLIGDLHGAAFPQQPSEASLVSRREHVFGQRRYATRVQILGSTHEILIECGGGALRVKVDGKMVLVVSRLAWKFRGKERITVGSSEADFYWDVFGWLCGSDVGGGGKGGHGVFGFQVGGGGVVWPEMVGPEKRLMRKSFSSGSSPSPGNFSVLQWAEEMDGSGGKSFSSSSPCSSGSSSSSSGSGGGFSLLLYAWRAD